MIQNSTHTGKKKGVAGNVFNESQLALDKRLNSCISQSNISRRKEFFRQLIHGES